MNFLIYTEQNKEKSHAFFDEFQQKWPFSDIARYVYDVKDIRLPDALIVSSPEPKAHGELKVYQSSRRPSVCPSVRVLTLSNTNISTTSWPIPTKFYLKHHWGGGKVALCFGPDRIGTLVSMATDSSYRVIIGKISLAL